MSPKKRSAYVPDNINEEYYQINPEILNSFSKYRPPVDLFNFREDIAVLAPFSRKGARLTNEQVEEAAQLCADGLLFVSRSDHHIYSQHIVKQLDLVLQDNNLKESEIVDICIQALQNRYKDFYEQPVKAFFDPLLADILVVTEYIVGDTPRMNAFVRRLFREHSPQIHAVNTFSVGLWLWLQKTQEIRRKDLDNMAIALLTHDVGMNRTPVCLLNKKGPLKAEEKEKILHHPLHSVKIMQKMEVVQNDVIQIIYEHQERMDGSGYPQRLKANQMSLPARLCALVDSFSAMITDRPYAVARTPLEAANELAMDPRYDADLARTLVAGCAKDQPGINWCAKKQD